MPRERDRVRDFEIERERELRSEWKIEQGRGGTQGVLLGWSQRKQRRVPPPSF